jgi:hypothetical protein
MKVRYAAWVVLFFALVAGAWYALRPPHVPDAGPASAAASGQSVAEARAASAPTSSKLGTAAVLSIDPRSGARTSGFNARRQTLWSDYATAKSYKAIYDRLNGSAEGETPEGRYVLYDMLRKCANVTERNTRAPMVRTTDQRRDQFLASLPENDPLRDKRIAAFEEVTTNRCAGLEGVSITQSALNNLLAQAAAGGDP